MNITLGEDKKEYPDGKVVWFKEMEISFSDVRYTIRIYPVNTYVTYHNDYRGHSKVLYKEPHAVSQQYMESWIKRIFLTSHFGTVSDWEIKSVLDSYWSLVRTPMTYKTYKRS